MLALARRAARVVRARSVTHATGDEEYRRQTFEAELKQELHGDRVHLKAEADALIRKGRAVEWRFAEALRTTGLRLVGPAPRRPHLQ